MKRICALLASVFFVGSLFAEIECWEDPHTGVTWYYSIREYDRTIELGSWTDMHSCVSNVYSGELSIPEKIKGRTVSVISDYAFVGCDQITGVTIPNTVTHFSILHGYEHLKYLRFMGNKPQNFDLQMYTRGPIANRFKVIVKDGATGWGNDAQQVIPKDGTYWDSTSGLSFLENESPDGDDCNCRYSIVGAEAIIEKCQLTDPHENVRIAFPQRIQGCTIVSVADSAFYALYCKELVLPSTITNIGHDAFNYCSVRNLTIPKGVRDIHYGTFWNCGYLTNIVFESELNLVEYDVYGWHSPFYNCKRLESIVVPPHGTLYYSTGACFLSHRGDRVIWARGMNDVPTSARELGPGLFWGGIDEYGIYTRQIGELSIPAAITSICERAFYETAIDQLHLPDGVVDIGPDAFYKCKFDTKRIVIPDSLKCLGEGAFGQSNITDVDVGRSLQYLGGYVFLHCSSLTNILFHGDAPTTWVDKFDRKNYSFSGVSKNFIIRVLPVSSGWGTVPGTWCDARIEYLIEPIPELRENATAEEIARAVDGSADESLIVNIVDLACYNAYRSWAKKIGADIVRASPNAWISFALAQDTLLQTTPTKEDLTIESFAPMSGSGRFDFTVSIKDINVGINASKENIKKVFGLEGASKLDNAAFSPDNVDVEFSDPVDGKVKFTAGPTNISAETFFMKLKLNQ